MQVGHASNWDLVREIPGAGLVQWPKTTFANFFIYFSSTRQIFARDGIARVLRLFAFLARILACVLRRPTTSSYLGGSLNGSRISCFPGPEIWTKHAARDAPPCNRRRGDPGAKSRRSKDENGAKHERQGRNQKHAKPSSPRLHRHEENRCHCHFRSMT